MKKIYSFFIIILLSILLSLLINHIAIRHIERKQISNIIQLLDNVIYKPQLHIEHESNLELNSKEQNQRFLEDIEIKYPEIMDIAYIYNDKYHYNNSGINKSVPEYIKQMIHNNVGVKLFDDPYNKTKTNYIFKFGSGYYIINFYSILLKNLSHNIITNFLVIDSSSIIPKGLLYYNLTHNAKHLHSVIISGLTIKKLLMILSFNFIISLFLINIISFLLLSYFDNNNILY